MSNYFVGKIGTLGRVCASGGHGGHRCPFFAKRTPHFLFVLAQGVKNKAIIGYFGTN